MREKWVYTFDEYADLKRALGGDDDAVRELLGGKGAGLGEMTAIGLPVPPGFTVVTRACGYFLEHGRFPEGLWEQVLEGLRYLEEKRGLRFGDPERPLLVSCRSGAKYSMPGMMDTILNLGLNDETVHGLAAMTQNPRFAWDAYRRLLQMFGKTVLGLPEEDFHRALKEEMEEQGAEDETQLSAQALERLVRRFKGVYMFHGRDFPQDPLQQLRMAMEAVFRSWNSPRARAYRQRTGIPDHLGTAVNIVAMVFGNLGPDSGTGVVFTRNPSTGEKELWGEYLVNAQGEDVVAGLRTPSPIARLAEEMPQAYAQLKDMAERLERHFRTMQDIEFTIERGKVWMLQTRAGKATPQAKVKMAVDMVHEGLISREEAVRRVSPDDVEQLLHPQFNPHDLAKARHEGRLLARGVNASPGAAVGRLYLDTEKARAKAQEGEPVILLRPFTKPEDVPAMLASKAIVTTEGGATSHAAVVARQFGIPAVVGASDIHIDMERRVIQVNGREYPEGTWVSVDGTSGQVFVGKLPAQPPALETLEELRILLDWADELAARPDVRPKHNGSPTRGLEVWANADLPKDAALARRLGARGIGLCRTEHMFFEPSRLPHMRRLILAADEEERRAALEVLFRHQVEDFLGLFRVMDGLPIIIRLLDPPLHEFLPSLLELVERVTEARAREEVDEEAEQLLAKVKELHEVNPMMGLRGVRLSILYPEIAEMQVRAIFEAACRARREGVHPKPRVMIPLVSHVNELKAIRERLERVAREVMDQHGLEIPYQFGTMIEVPRAALTAGEIAQVAEFFSFGTNDLTQMTFGFSRDDAEKNFLIRYLDRGILPANPFQTLDEAGVGRLLRIAVEEGRAARPGMSIGICGEHGGDPASIRFCHRIGLDYVSCSPMRVPVARMAAAHAALESLAESERQQVLPAAHPV